MSTERSLATRLVAFRVLRDMLIQAEHQARAELDAVLIGGDRAVAVVYPADSDEPIPVGAVTKTKPGPETVTVRVVDELALLNWCVQFHADEIVSTIRPAFRSLLLEKAAETGGFWVNRHGVALPVDGIELVPKPGAASTLQVRPAEDAAELIRQAWTDGTLSLDTLLALPAGESS